MGEKELGIFFFAVSMILLILFVSIVFFIIRYRRRKMEHEDEKRKLEMQHTEELIKTKTELQVSVMKLIGAELHDTINQRLTLAYLHTGNMQKIEDAGKLKMYAGEIGKIIMLTQNEIRGLSKILSGDGFSEFGLCGFLEKELQRIRLLGTCDTALTLKGEPPSFANEKAELMLARICQEFIQNSLKHAEAALLEITVDNSGERLMICCQDNGKGFDTDLVQKGTGQGLGNIMKRAEMINAVITWQTNPGKGTRLAINL